MEMKSLKMMKVRVLQWCHTVRLAVLAYLEQQPGVPVSTTVTINSLLVEVAKKRSKNKQKLQNILHMT